MKDYIRVIYCPVDRDPHYMVIKNDLKTMQDIVGGYIETWTEKDYVIVCNEEGYIKGLPLNPSMPGFVGNLFICGYEGEDFTDLPDELAPKLRWKCQGNYGKGNDKAAISG